MTETREYTRSTSPENFEKLYSQLSDSEKALISAYMDVTFALLKNMQDMMKHKEA